MKYYISVLRHGCFRSTPLGSRTEAKRFLVIELVHFYEGLEKGTLLDIFCLIIHSFYSIYI